MDYALVGEEEEDLDFVYRITGQDLTPEKLRNQLEEINETPLSELADRAMAARNYFDSTVRSYFEDPTAYFRTWLDKKETNS